jgi:hypothetical protein
MRYKDFEEFLEDEHSEVYVGLDDDMPDDFNYWLCDLDPDEWIELGDKYADQRVSYLYEQSVKQTFEKKIGG